MITPTEPSTAPAEDTVIKPAIQVEARLASALGAQYQVRRMVGRGGFAEVYEVWDQGLERRLAVKVLRPDLSWTAGTLARFQQEARAIARLQHPNILPVFFVGEGEGIVWYAMPFVEGESMTSVLKRGPLEPERAVSLVLPVLDALAYAHAQGLVHRDIKPENIMLEAATSRPLLVDFGIAKRLQAGPGVTQSGFVVGTPTYMSPEQALGQPDVDHRADVYSLGAVLFQLVTGAPPYEGETSQEVVGKHLYSPIPRASDRAPRVPRWLSTVIERALAKKPAERYQSASELGQALRDGVSGRLAPVSAVSDEPPPAPAPRENRPRRRPVRWVGALLLAGGATWAVLEVTSPRVAITNKLALPIGVLVNGAAERRVPPGGALRERVARGKPVDVQWFAVPPRGTDGQPVGQDLQGTLSLPNLRGQRTVVASADIGGDPLFIPIITNNTGVTLTFRVNAGSLDVQSCRCEVPAGAVRQPIGLFPLYRNSSVQAIAPDGRTATFENLGPEVDRASGAVRLRFEARDLR